MLKDFGVSLASISLICNVSAPEAVVGRRSKRFKT
jgi:hypothetical protein